MSAAAVARRRDSQLDIVAFERGPYTSYSACGIPYYVSGLVEGADRLISRSPDEYARAGIDARTRCEVIEIDLGARVLTYFDHPGRTERKEGFDQLVYATGAVAIAPPVPGVELVEPVRTVDAAERLVSRIHRTPARHAVVVGASYLGLEMAEALLLRGMQVTLIDRGSQVMPSLDADMAAHVQTAAEGEGIRVLLSTELQEVRGDNEGRPRSVGTSAGELPADHVVMSTGSAPNVALASAAGLQVGATGALQVDDHQRCVCHDGVYAAGDCTEMWHRLLHRSVNLQLGTHANKQGRVAGTNATGGDVAFPGVIGTAVSKLCRYEVARTGLSKKEAEADRIDVRTATIKSRTRAGSYPGAGPIWVKLIADARTHRLLGGQIIGTEGAAKRIDVLATAIWHEATVDGLEMLDLGYAPPFSGVYDPLLIAARQLAQQLSQPE
ncbi:MAG: FAD-dependent oxidoreductase [Actinomycetota bacterium]|nr:FAD-dependent oxidoreductase [Actinomycetota bacterium]